MPRLPEIASYSSQLEHEIITTESFLDQWLSPKHRLKQCDKLRSTFTSLPLEKSTISLLQQPSFTDAEPQDQITILLNEVYPDEHDRQKLFAAIVESEITPAEYALLLHVSLGMDNKQIATKQEISYQMVKNHLTRLLKKLSDLKETEVFDRNTAFITALESGFLPERLVPSFLEIVLDQNRKESFKRFSSLSHQQQEILSLTSQGLTNEQIAQELSTNDQTVRNHNLSAYKKLEVHDRTQAMLCYLSAKLFEDKVKSSYPISNSQPQKIGIRVRKKKSESNIFIIDEPSPLESFLESWIRWSHQTTKINTTLRQIPFTEEVSPSYLSMIEDPSPELELLVHFERLYPNEKEQQRALSSTTESQLSPTEYAFLLLSLHGRRNQEMSDLLETELNTTKNHFSSIFYKLSRTSNALVNTKTNAILVALEKGIIPEVLVNNYPQFYLSQTRRESISRYQSLTFREKEVVNAIARGCTNHDIAKQLEISSNTVHEHIHNVLKILNCRNRTQVTLYHLSMAHLAEQE